MFGDLFGGFGRGRTQTAARPQKGADVETTATIGFNDAIDGVTISLRLTSDAPCPDCSGTGGKPGTRPRICPECEGAGFIVNTVGGAFSLNETCPKCGGRQLIYDEPCPTCHGSGRGLSARSIQARIPAGVKDGQRIRLRGKGSAGVNGGPPGDLFVAVKVTPHRLFGRKGDNLTLDVPISFDEAALGAEIKIPTLGGAPVTVKVPAGTPNGRTFRVRGKGARKKDGTNGDLLATVQVQVPVAPRRTGPGGRRDLPRRDGRQAAARQPVRRGGWTDDRQAAVLRRAQPGRCGLRHQRRRGADRPAPADAAHLRADGADHARPHRRRWPPLLARATSTCSARSPTSPSSGIGIEGVRRILELEDRIAALVSPQRGARRRARGDPGGAASGRERPYRTDVGRNASRPSARPSAASPSWSGDEAADRRRFVCGLAAVSALGDADEPFANSPAGEDR